MMNTIKYLVLSVFLATLAGCATRTTTGREFDVANIAKIQKGVTPRNELVSLFGRPLDVSTLSGDEVVWEYSWKTATSQTQPGPDGPVVTSQGDKKTLEVLIKNGVVINYRYADDPFWIEKLKGAQ